MSSYQISQEYNFQSILWDVAGALWRIGRYSPQNGRRALQWALPLLCLLWADLALLGRSVATVAAWGLVVVGTVGALAILFMNPLFLVGLTLTGAFAVATMPKGVRSGS